MLGRFVLVGHALTVFPELLERGPESAPCGNRILIHAVNEANITDTWYLVTIARERTSSIHTENLASRHEAGGRLDKGHSMIDAKANVVIEDFALLDKRLAARRGEVEAATGNALAISSEDLREAAEKGVDDAAITTDGVELSGVDLSLDFAIIFSRGFISAGVRNRVGAVGASISIRGVGFSGGGAAGAEARAVAARSHHAREAVRARLSVAKGVYSLTASHTALVVNSKVDTTKCKHARNLGILFVFSRERNSLVKAAYLSSGLATTGRHYLFAVLFAQNAALVLNIRPSA